MPILAAHTVIRFGDRGSRKEMLLGDDGRILRCVVVGAGGFVLIPLGKCGLSSASIR